ncbi:cilia- and flagella-associated protein 157 [Genypterus blacodes]|uniref:cilia- and flagella-associated protein 157 n=1 Tax=Genypterus blacodes TaxID=154954 RepID=UPI003F769595
MPQIKDKKRRDAKNEDKKKKTETDKTSSEEKEKQYLIEIQHLDQQLARSQQKYNELDNQRKDFILQYSTLEKEKKDIVEYLNFSLSEEKAAVTELTEQLQALQQASKQETSDLLLQHSQLRQELLDKNDFLTTDNTALVAKLADLEEFQVHKEQLMSDLEFMEKQLANQKEEHKVAIHSMEMKALMERERLKKEMQSHMEVTAVELQRLAYQKIPAKAKMVLEKNMEGRARFNQMSDQAQVLLQENKALRELESQLRVEVDILDQQLSTFSRKSCALKKVVEQLTKKCQQLQAEVQDCRQEHQQLQTEHKGVLLDMESLRQEQASLLEESIKNGAKDEQLKTELEDERRRASHLQSIVQEAGTALRRAMMEACTEQKMNSTIQWIQVMHNLLVVLDSAVPLGTNATSEEQTP